MNKLFTKIAALALGAAMAFGVGIAVSSKAKDVKPAEAAGKDDWVQVTALSGLNTTDTYVIANDADKGYFMNGTTSSGHFQSTAFGASAPASATAAGAFKLEAVNATNNIYKIKLVSTNKYVKASKAGSGGGTVTDSSDSAGWKFLVSGTSFNAIYQTAYSSKYAALRCYSNTSWRTYQNGNATSITTTSGTVFRLYKYQTTTNYTVTFTVNTAGYGTVSSSSLSVPSGSSITTNGNKVTINGNVVTATPTTSTAQYTYAFTGWSNNTGTVTGNRTITANFSRTTNTFTVSGNITRGSLDNTTSIAYDGDLDLNIVPITGYTYPASVSVTMGGNDISNDVQYEDGYLFYSPVRGNIVITATCPAAGNTYSITTNVTNGTYSGDTSITDNGGVASVTIAPTGDYKLPVSVSVSGADHTYNADTGAISLSNATGNVTISAAMVALTEYSITVNETNGSHTGASTIKESRTASLTFEPDTNYGNPADVTVSGATYTWTRDSGVLSLSNPTGNVTVTYVASENELTSITISANSGSYTLGDAFVKPVITAHYSVAADQVVTTSPNVEISGYDPYTTGSQPVTINYTEGGITKSASYTATVSAASVQTTTYYQKCTSMSDIVDGGKYVLIGYKEAATTYYAMPSYSSGNNIQGASVTLTENETRLTEANMSTAAVYTLTSTGTTNQYYIGDGTQYLYAAGSGTNNHLKGKASTDSSAGAFTISYSTFFSVVAASSNRNTMRFNASNNPPIFSCYASNDNQTEIMFFKEVKEQTGSADLIRITASYSGDPKYVGDPISTSDFTVKKQLNTGNELIDVASGYTISANTLTAESNSITVSLTEGNITKTAVVVVPATPRSATVTSVTLVQGIEVVKDYIDYSAAAWDYTGLTVHCVWSDSTFNEDLSVADLIQSGDATVSPAKPAVGVTSFTISYEYHEVSMTSNSVTGINVVADYVTGISWTGTTGSHFKAFSGSQLTAAQVGAWSVVPTFAGAGAQSALSFGDYVLKVGTKTISSLPYTWTSEDDGQELSITYGKDVDGNDFVKKNGTAVANICATINAIDHTETISGDIEKSVTWSKDDSIAAYGTTSLCDDGVALDENIFMQGAKGDAGTEIRFWSDGIRTYTGGNTLTFTPSNGAVITKITLPTVTVTSDSTSSESSPYTITGGGSAVTFDIGSKSTIGSDIVVEYTINGSETTTVHYANDINHFDAQKKVVEFAKFMNTTMNGTNVCSGTFANLGSAWDDVAGKYDELFGASTTLNETELAWAKNMLKYAYAIWGSDAEAACVEKAMKTYEHCVAKYELEAFMSGLRSVSKTSIINPIIDVNNNAPVLVTVIVSMIGLSAVGGYFFLRKRKENI